jgi:hypothetical protein
MSTEELEELCNEARPELSRPTTGEFRAFGGEESRA